jgi:hypothetical protein
LQAAPPNSSSYRASDTSSSAPTRVMASSWPPDALFEGSEDVLHEKFESALAKHLLTQSTKLRGLEDALREESTAMLKLLQDQVMAQIAGAGSHKEVSPTVPGLANMMDELFERSEVRQGLVEWLADTEARRQADELVKELREDISRGDGNEARTTMNKLLPLYMEALSVREILQMFGDQAPTASPGGNQRKMLGHLVNAAVRPYLEALRMMHADSVGGSDVESYSADKTVNLRETANRLTSALFVFLNTGNFASHHRGRISYCQQLELCAAMGAMAETLPQVFHACQDVKGARAEKPAETPSPMTSVINTAADNLTTSNNDVEGDLEDKAAELPEPLVISIPQVDDSTVKTTKRAERGDAVTEAMDQAPALTVEVSSVLTPSDSRPTATISVEETPVQFNWVAYYKSFLIDCSPVVQAKYESTLLHMELVPKARVCTKGNACTNGDICTESHSSMEALPFNPLVLTLKCPVPERSRSDSIHDAKLCLFNHGEYKGSSTLRWGKKYLCQAQASCTDFKCVKSHSKAEVCWFNPFFRTADCPEGRSCPWKHNCSGFHQEYHLSKRSLRRNEYLGTTEPILFVERTIAALRKTSSPPRPKSPFSGSNAKPATPGTAQRLVKYYDRNVQKQTHLSISERDKYSRVLSHMKVVPKARICMDAANGKSCTKSDNGKPCSESHTLAEALTFNPLAMVLACPTPASCREDFIHPNGLCVFFHGDGTVPKDFLKTKRLLCDDLGDCKDESCLKSHSDAEVCWHFTEFRAYKCPQGSACKRMGSCSYYHREFHMKRDHAMNNVVGTREPALFIERGYAELTTHAPSSVNGLCVGDLDNEDSKQPAPQLIDDETTSVHDGAGVTTRDGSCTMLDYEQALKAVSVEECAKYEDVLTHMKMVPKARLCTFGEACPHRQGAIDADDTATCVESHSRLEALQFNPLTMVLQCPIVLACARNDVHQQALCIFDHGDGSIPKGFLKDKKSLCEAYDGCENEKCAKSHSVTEVCWFNPQFRVSDCLQGDLCLDKANCIGFHVECHRTRRDSTMNNQVGALDRIEFVGRGYAELSRRRGQTLRTTHPLQDDASLRDDVEPLRDQEAVSQQPAAISPRQENPEPNAQLEDEPSKENCKLS